MEIGQIDDLIKQDIKDIENHLKIGKLDVADFSKDLFGRMFGEKIASVQKYATVAKQYLPPPKIRMTKSTLSSRASVVKVKTFAFQSKAVIHSFG